MVGSNGVMLGIDLVNSCVGDGKSGLPAYCSISVMPSNPRLGLLNEVKRVW
jgi:hypothetical protein